MHEHVPSSSRVLRPRAARAPAPYPKKSTTKTLTKFTCFDKLPFELREMVWKSALPGPRTITVSKTDKSVPQVKTNAKGILPTPLMHTCHESRQLALQRYKPAFSVFLEGNKDIYFDWERDCLQFKGGFEFRYFCGVFHSSSIDKRVIPEFWINWQKKLHHLALGGKRFDEPNEVCLMENLGTLKTLVLQHRDYGLEDENVKKTLEKVWSPYLADQNMLPKISFVSKAEFEWREDQEKVSKLS
jgi:hypothetical protein